MEQGECGELALVMAQAVLVLVPHTEGIVPPPQATPLGRAALALAKETIPVVFGSSMSALHAAHADTWRQVTPEVCAIYDRYPSQSLPRAFAQACADFAGLPMGNPPFFTELCRDKVGCQAFLVSRGIPMPALVTEPEQFEAAVSEWGGAFLKPRYGGLGRGVSRVGPDDALPSHGEGAVKGVVEPLFLQQAVGPPAGVAGLAIRWLVQRLPSGRWLLAEPVARLSRTDPVANVSRGAEARPARELLSKTAFSRGADLVLSCAAALAEMPGGAWLVELGVDLVLDSEGLPHVIELNSRPRGHLESLADLHPTGFGAQHLEACCRPIRFLHSPC